MDQQENTTYNPKDYVAAGTFKHLFGSIAGARFQSDRLFTNGTYSTAGETKYFSRLVALKRNDGTWDVIEKQLRDYSDAVGSFTNLVGMEPVLKNLTKDQARQQIDNFNEKCDQTLPYNKHGKKTAAKPVTS